VPHRHHLDFGEFLSSALVFTSTLPTIVTGCGCVPVYLYLGAGVYPCICIWVRVCTRVSVSGCGCVSVLVDGQIVQSDFDEACPVETT